MSRSRFAALAAGLALVTEDRKRSGLVSNASVLENLTLPALDRFRRGVLLDDAAREGYSGLNITFPCKQAVMPLLHGEAIAIGMRLAFTFSVELGLCPAGDAARVARTVSASGARSRRRARTRTKTP